MDCCNDNIILRDARPEDARFIAWVVLTALDMDTEHLDLVTESVADPESMYSWTNTVMAAHGPRCGKVLIPNRSDRRRPRPVPANITSIQWR